MTSPRGGFAADECAKAAQLILDAGFDRIDYVECRDAHSLELIERVDDEETRIFAAAYLGPARLIDNHSVS